MNSLSLSSDGLVLYAGTKGEGVFRLSTLSQEQIEELAPTPTPVAPTPTAHPTSPPAEMPTSAPQQPMGGLPCLGGALPLAIIGLFWPRRRE